MANLHYDFEFAFSILLVYITGKKFIKTNFLHF